MLLWGCSFWIVCHFYCVYLILNIERSDLFGSAVIDEDPGAHGSHGKDQFVYSARSPGSLWQLDLYYAGLHHRFLISSLAYRPFFSIQCILIRKGKLAPDLTVGLTQRWGRRAEGRSWKRNQTFCLENEMWAAPWEFFQPTLSSLPLLLLLHHLLQ